MSEFGFQSFPEFSSVKKYTKEEDHDIFSEVMKSHQRSSIGNGTIEEYMLRHYRRPKDFESFLYVSQLLQAHGIKIGIEAHRRNMDRCMGSLYWQINDCWPVASWSSIDYYGKWKALHYATKKSFEKFLISYESTEESVAVFLVSDSLQQTSADLQLKLIDFDGKILKSWNEQLTVQANGTKKHYELSKDELSQVANDKNVVLVAELVDNNRILATNTHYMSPFKALDFPDPGITYSVTDKGSYFEVLLKTEKLAKDVFLATNSVDNFSDNYFDMLPGSEKLVSIAKGQYKDLASFKEDLKVMTLLDSYEKSAKLASN